MAPTATDKAVTNKVQRVSLAVVQTLQSDTEKQTERRGKFPAEVA